MTSWNAGGPRFAFWGSVATLAIALSILGLVMLRVNEALPEDDEPSSLRAGLVRGVAPLRLASDQQGLLVNNPRACPGYTLVAPINSRKTYLLDLKGRVVRSWESRYAAGQSAYLLEDGHLLRAARLDTDEQIFGGNAQGGRVQKFTWDGELIWDYKYHNDRQLAHHDVCAMPNGNVLLIVWEIKTAEEAVAAGRKPGTAHGRWLTDSVIEVKPTGKTTAEVVWEWHAWDHLVQGHDPSRHNYGDVGLHPELIDVNFGDDGVSFRDPGQPAGSVNRKEDSKKSHELAKLKSLGYVGTLAATGNRWMIPDWNHVNAIAYNAELDQILLSPRLFNEIWVIDHSTTTSEAAGHMGGRSGRGGDLLYRWGNPRAHHAGTKADQKLFYQHDAHWISPGRPGAAHILVFNNGGPAGRNFSSVDELFLPVDTTGHYGHGPDAAFGPIDPAWSYTAPKKEDFFASVMSGADRLSNGNTLICDGVRGMIFEVTPQHETVWLYVIPDRLGTPSGGPAAGVPIFRAYRYAPDYRGLAGKELSRGKMLEGPEGKRPEKI